MQPWKFCVSLCTLLLALSACSSDPANVQGKAFSIKANAAPSLNRDPGGRSLSVVVRLYQLKTPDEFSKLTFDMVASDRPETELLGQSLVDKQEFILVPGGQYTNNEKIKADAKYVGVVGLFRQPDQHYWRYLIDASKIQDGLTIKAQNCYLTLENVKPFPIPGQPANAVPVCGNGNP